MEQLVYKFNTKTGAKHVYYNGSYYSNRTCTNGIYYWYCVVRSCNSRIHSYGDYLKKFLGDCNHPKKERKWYSDVPVDMERPIERKITLASILRTMTPEKKSNQYKKKKQLNTTTTSKLNATHTNDNGSNPAVLNGNSSTTVSKNVDNKLKRSRSEIEITTAQAGNRKKKTSLTEPALNRSKSLTSGDLNTLAATKSSKSIGSTNKSNSSSSSITTKKKSCKDATTSRVDKRPLANPVVALQDISPILVTYNGDISTLNTEIPYITGDDAAEFPGTSAGGGGGGMGLEDTTSPPEHFLNDSMAPTPQHPIPPPASNRPESYKLCHNNHLSLVLEALAADESFMDVTLTAQGKSLKAHKSVLSAVSPYFRGVLKDNPCQHPIIIMPRDVKYDELNNIISYIYRGEMTVATEDLPSLLKTAEILQVTGLSPSESMPGVGGLNDTMSSAMQSPVPRTPQHKGHQANKHTSASSIQSLDSTSNSDIIVPADFMDVNLTCVKEEIANLEETTINNTDEDNTTTNTNTENNDDSIIEDDDDDGGDDPVENHRPPAKRRRTNPKSPDTNDTTTTNNTDADPKPNQCPYCETSPKDYNAIMDHMKEKHSNKKPFICSNCCRIYIKNDPYSEHVKACPKAST